MKSINISLLKLNSILYEYICTCYLKETVYPVTYLSKLYFMNIFKIINTS